MSGLKDTSAYVAMKEAKKALVRRLKLPKYLGSAFTCTVCGTGLRTFKPIWKSYMRRAAEVGYLYPLSSVETFNTQAFSCPACDASDRERLYALYFDTLFRTFDRQRRHRFVEFAPSPALQRKIRRYPFIDFRSADLYRHTVDDRVDITDMRAYPDNSIDIFLCSHILEHVPEDRKAMREMYRALRPAGIAVVMVPIIHGVEETLEDPAITTPDLRWKHYGLDDHIRQYGKTDFIRRLTATGFAMGQLDVSHFGEAAFRKAGLAMDSVLYVATKPQAEASG